MMGAWRPKHIEWLWRNKTCTVLHQVGVLFDRCFKLVRKTRQDRIWRHKSRCAGCNVPDWKRFRKVSFLALVTLYAKLCRCSWLPSLSCYWSTRQSADIVGFPHSGRAARRAKAPSAFLSLYFAFSVYDVWAYTFSVLVQGISNYSCLVKKFGVLHHLIKFKTGIIYLL